MNINIKGVPYKIKWEDNYILDDAIVCAGMCNKINKEIRLSNKEHEYFKDRTIRHELVHAFFHECGLSQYEDDEILVEWIARHIPEIEKCFNEIKNKVVH